MVRTKADGSTRVAAGGKAPKKNASKPVSTHSPSSHDKGGKDHLPGNRACPRETPAWQKKITFFYDKNAMQNQSTEDSVQEGSSSSSKDTLNQKGENGSEMDENELPSTQATDGDNDEMEEGNSSILESSKVNESMETGE